MEFGVQETIGDHFHGGDAGNAGQDEQDHADARPQADLGKGRDREGRGKDDIAGRK